MKKRKIDFTMLSKKYTKMERLRLNIIQNVIDRLVGVDQEYTFDHHAEDVMRGLIIDYMELYYSYDKSFPIHELTLAIQKYCIDPLNKYSDDEMDTFYEKIANLIRYVMKKEIQKLRMRDLSY